MNKKDKERIQEVLDKNRNSIEGVSRVLVTRIVLTAGNGSNENPGNNINIYDYDCGNKVIKTLSGRYGIYVAGDRGVFLNKGAVIFEKWED